MTTPRSLDLLIKNVRLVRPAHPEVVPVDVGVRDGRFVQIDRSIAATDARQVYDGRGWLAFPGVVDAHTHAGIYAPVA
jgi:allantoinase